MLPLLTYPLALIGLASLPALAAIYLLRNRFRRRTVSSLMLWQLQERSQEGGVKMQQVQLPWIFFLELLILALLVMAATGPRWRIGAGAKPLIVVLDDSVSMRAESIGGSPRERAIETLEKLFSAEAFQSVRFILAGERPSVLGSPLPAGSAIAELEAWHCRAAAAELNAGIAFAREIGRDEALVLVLTDQPVPKALRDATKLRWLALGAATPNVAFVNAARSIGEEGDRCLLEIANHSRRPGKTVLRVFAGEKVLRETKLEIGSNAVRRVVLNLPTGTPAIRARLADDALAADNEVALLPPPRERIRVKVSIEDENLRELVERTLDATGMRSAVNTSPQLLIHDQAGRPSGTNTWSVQFHAAEDAGALTGPFVMDGSHPVTRGVSLVGVVWAAAARTNRPNELVLATVGDRSLMSVERDLLGRQKLLLNLNPRLSTVAQSPDWPILFWNILEWRRSALPGLDEVNFRPGTDVRIRTRGNRVALTHPDERIEELAVGQGELIARTDAAGLYGVEAEDGKWQFAVNFLAAEESDLRGATTGEWGKWETDDESRRQYASVLWLFALMALSGMFAHHYFITHGRSRL